MSVAADGYKLGRVWVSIEDRGFFTPCHIWTGAQNSKGYGTRTLNKEPLLVHRWAYTQAHGTPIERGARVHHQCEVKLCLNPDHLVLLTEREHKRHHLGWIVAEEIALTLLRHGPATKRAMCQLGGAFGIHGDVINVALQTMLKQGRVERVRRGVYVLPFTTEDS